jgi:hypothetical protein
LRKFGCRRVDRKLRVGPRIGWLLDRISPARASRNGHNASGWRADNESVNGIDEPMAKGGEDREMGERLQNAGIRGRRIRHRAVCVHLDHARGYVTEEAIAKNRVIRAETRAAKSRWSKFGIQRGRHETEVRTSGSTAPPRGD